MIDLADIAWSRQRIIKQDQKPIPYKPLIGVTIRVSFGRINPCVEVAPGGHSSLSNVFGAKLQQ
jgi:hypothetical protein